MYGLLIAEDEPLVRKGIRNLIDYSQFDIHIVEEAADGREAWQIFQEKPIDIVLTDINMPHLDGISLAQLIKEREPRTHVVFLTGYDEFDYALSALKLGADDYLLKPFSKTDVEQILSQILLHLRQAQTEIEVKELVEGKHHSSLGQAIQERLSDPNLTLKNLADQLGFSANYLSQLIKNDVGQPFQHYLIAERIRKAKLLLLTTDLKIYEIAEQVGFEDMNYFSQRFKLETGKTPRQFRKEHD
ncbi:response regulator transcription factor [Streptococcus merionis]|uniref:Two-component response transcriptional regulator n=1 Tax=Streptococcus merionis TaxID=400065 RepID=A0A239SQF3_9STRE|nr:response regulator [Streptococcus merionis]SNU87640.1 Two-component response transcriptional regulator [Streptococcus merionis]